MALLRAGVLLLALLAAGCLTAGDDLVDRAGMPDGPTTGARPSSPSPPAGAAAPEDPRGTPASPGVEGECGNLTLTASRATLRPGEEATFHGVLRNCGSAPLERTTPCTAPQWEPRFTLRGAEFHVLQGAATSGVACLTAIGQWRVEPGATMERTWTWNGTLEDCRATCGYRDAPPGRYELTSALPKKDAMTQAGEGAWTASVVVEVLPRA
jgi:hypothetical protein